MATNIELRRDHEGSLNLYVSGVPALNATVTGVQMLNDELTAVIVVPLKHATIGEVETVVPFARPSGRRAA